MSSVLFYDDRGGFSPTWNRERDVGGAEIHLVQIAEWLAAHGHCVNVMTHASERKEVNGVMYVDSRGWDPRFDQGTIVIVGCASIPTTCKYRQAFAFQVVDPRPHPHMWDHLRGRATMVCVSEWQAELFREIGHEAVVIPVPIPDEWYMAAQNRYIVPGRSVCLSSWNKGAQATLDAWDPAWGELAIGSAYSQPIDAEDRCMAKGAVWLGKTKRATWIAALATAERVVRVCTIGETFGVVDVAARAMGMPCYTLCTGDVGSLREVGARPFTDPAEWREAIRQKVPYPGGDAERFRASKVLPMWEGLING